MTKTMKKTDGRRDKARNVLEWYEAVISAVMLMVVVFSFFFRIVEVDGSSMVPTLNNADRLIVWGAGYTPQPGDVIIIDSYTGLQKPLVKRIIAMGGDTLDIDFVTGDVTVNGVVLNEPYIAETTHLSYDMTFPLTVPEGTVFVMGDNRNGSNDSRSSRLGFIDNRDVLGKVLVRILPFGDIGVIQ